MAQNTSRRLKIVAGADSFGGSLKDSLVNHLRSLNIDVEDLGTSDKYYSVGEEIGRRVSTTTSDDTETRGLVACGTGVGVSIFANKFPGVYAATCLTPGDALNSRSVNNSNVLAVSGMSTSPESAVEILDAWLNTPFKSPCPASDSKPWPTEIDSFLENSISEMSKIGEGGPEPKNKDTSSSCAICWLNSRNKDKPEGDFTPIEMMRGGSMKLLRETPTSAVVRFESGSVEPAHHHTFGHDLVVMKGKKKVWNLSKKEEYDLGVGDYLFTPAGDVHRVKYWEDTEFFIKWDGHWDVFMDEDLDAANAVIDLCVISACIGQFGQLRTQYVLSRYVALPVSAWVKNQEVNDLLRKTKDRGLKQSLAICVSLNEDAVNFDIPRAIQSVGKDNFTARTGTDALFDDADICEDQFSGSPIKAENNIIKQLAAIALGIINRLG